MSLTQIKNLLSAKLSNLCCCGDRSIPKPPMLALFIFFVVTFAYFYHSGQHNANARFDQARIIVEEGVLHIDKYRFNTADVVDKEVPIFSDDTTFFNFLPFFPLPELIGSERHVFPNKAPGTSFIAVPVWWGLEKFFSLFNLPQWIVEHFMPYLTIVLTLGIITSLMALCLYGVLERMLNSAPLALILSVAWALGSIAFPFTTIFFSHQLAAALCFFSFAIVYCYKENVRVDSGISDGPRCALPFNSPWWLLPAGFCAGFALSTEYPTLLAVAPICLYVIIVLIPLPKRRWLWYGLFLLGVIIGGMFLVWYNIKIDGKIFYIPYSEYAEGRNKQFQEHKQGAWGVTFIKDKETLKLIETNLKRITYKPQRGLFYCNPWTILVLPGIFMWVFWRRRRWEGALAAIVVVAFFFFNAGYGKSIVFWGGGYSVGPRHIIPMLPFLTILVACVVRWLPVRIVFYPLLLLSLSIMLMATAVEPRVPYEYMHPVRDLFWQNYIQARFAIYDFGVFNSTFLTDDSVAFNLGKLIRLKPTLQLLPLFAFWVALAWYILRRTAKRHSALGDLIRKQFQEEGFNVSTDGPSDEIESSHINVYEESLPAPYKKITDEETEDKTKISEGNDAEAVTENNEITDETPASSSQEEGRKSAGTSFLNWLNRMNDYRRPALHYFSAPIAYIVFVIWIAVMFSIPIVHAWSERQKEVAGKGLKGTYIRGVEWSAQPANSWKPVPVDGKKVIMERVDQHINFNWIEKAPPIPSAFSVIWNGYVYIPKDGAWTFAVECDDGGALYINKRLVVNNWGFHAPQLKQGRISLKEGYHPITILYYNKQFGALMRLKWSPPGQHMETIPSKFLFVTNPDKVIEKKIEPQSKL